MDHGRAGVGSGGEVVRCDSITGSLYYNGKECVCYGADKSCVQSTRKYPGILQNISISIHSKRFPRSARNGKPRLIDGDRISETENSYGPPELRWARFCGAAAHREPSGNPE